jgi:hypothetical protein
MTDLRERLAASVGGMERLAGFFSARTMGDLNRRAQLEVMEGAQMIEEALERTEKAIKAAGLEEYHSGSGALERVLIRLWAMHQNAASRTANWFVTGPSNFPVARNEKRMRSADNRWKEFHEVAKSAPERALRIARATQRARIGAGGLADIELADLKRRLEERELRQRMMKATNEAIRREKIGRDGAEQLAEVMKARGFPEISQAVAHQLLTPDYGRAGFASYQLSNNNAEIHRLQARIAQVERKCQRIVTADERSTVYCSGHGYIGKDACPHCAEQATDSEAVRIVEDHADDRLRLIFPGKPAPQVIRALKSRGFRWSPSNGAWQRQLTANARHAAEQVVRQLAEPVLN